MGFGLGSGSGMNLGTHGVADLDPLAGIPEVAKA